MTLQDYLDLYFELTYTFSKCYERLPKGKFENTIRDAMYCNNWILDGLLKIAADEHNVDLDNLRWFIFENDCGERELELSGIPIKDLHDFVLYEYGNKYKLKNGKVVICNLEEVEGSMIFDVLPNNLTTIEIVELLYYYYKDLE